MSCPAEGFQSTLSNNIDDVVDFLNEQHHDNYAIFNLTSRRYNTSRSADFEIRNFLQIVT